MAGRDIVTMWRYSPQWDNRDLCADNPQRAGSSMGVVTDPAMRGDPLFKTMSAGFLGYSLKGPHPLRFEPDLTP